MTHSRAREEKIEELYAELIDIQDQPFNYQEVSYKKLIGIAFDWQRERDLEEMAQELRDVEQQYEHECYSDQSRQGFNNAITHMENALEAMRGKE